jgi:hypothetical protein
VRSVRGAGYRSSVRSTPEVALDDEEPGSAALDNLTKAIDKLAADSRDGTTPPHLAERIARLWEMVSDLDPELAKRRAAYDRPDDPRS